MLRRFAVLFWSCLALPAVVHAQGQIISPEPIRDPRFRGGITTLPLEIKYLRVNTEITDGIAVTSVSQSFANPLNRVIEGTFVFPLPDGAAVGEFSMNMNGKVMNGEVLERDRARETYERIVRQTRDPALLEFVGNRLYQASIAPIPAGGMVEITLQYSQTLSETNGQGEFAHPLRALAQSPNAVQELSIHVKLRSTRGLASAYCPSHTCQLSRTDDKSATFSFEQSNVRPDRDLQIFYQSAAGGPLGMMLLTSRAAGEPGYFLLRIAPRVEIKSEEVQPKDIAFVVDTSGSMQGDKIEQARKALRFCVGSLNGGDRFNIFAFSSDVRPFRDELVAASGDIKDSANKFIDGLKALGGTNINGALLKALSNDPGDATRPYLIVFMTDGQPTVDVTWPATILDNVKSKNSHQVRFHVLGVGSDVNTQLLDQLAELNRGSREYCVENENLENKMSNFVGRLTNPVLTDLALDFGGLKVRDVYPPQIPDLFHGGEVVVMGRYENDGAFAVKLSGKLRGDTQNFAVEGNFAPIARGNDALARLWANRKVAYLLDQTRLHGASSEVREEIVVLAKRFGIVTPYTSALIVEDGAMPSVNVLSVAPSTPRRNASTGVTGGGRMGGAGSRADKPAAAPTGKAAVQESVQLRDLGYTAALSDDDAEEAKKRDVKKQNVGDRTFVLSDGRWVDTTWDGKAEARKIVAFSDEYFTLLRDKPETAKILAIGERVLFVLDGKVLEVVPEPAKP